MIFWHFFFHCSFFKAPGVTFRLSQIFSLCYWSLASIHTCCISRCSGSVFNGLREPYFEVESGSRYGIWINLPERPCKNVENFQQQLKSFLNTVFLKHSAVVIKKKKISGRIKKQAGSAFSLRFCFRIKRFPNPKHY